MPQHVGCPGEVRRRGLSIPGDANRAPPLHLLDGALHTAVSMGPAKLRNRSTGWPWRLRHQDDLPAQIAARHLLEGNSRVAQWMGGADERTERARGTEIDETPQLP